MNSPTWSTSCYSRAADTTPMELDDLREHMTQCTDKRGRLVAMQCTALRLRGLVMSRLVTTLAVLAVLGSVGVMLLL
jgi:hypothetical protein